MDQSSGAGSLNPAAVAASLESIIKNHQVGLENGDGTALPSSQLRNYTVADLFGRCFLRVCYWVDVFSSLTRRGEPLPYVPFPRGNVATRRGEEMLNGHSANPSAGSPPVATA